MYGTPSQEAVHLINGNPKIPFWATPFRLNEKFYSNS